MTTDLVNRRILQLHLKRAIERSCYQYKLDDRHFRLSVEEENEYFDKVLRCQIEWMVGKLEGKPIVYKYPASWWESFKIAWFPKWMIDRYPIRYYQKVINNSAVFTNLDIPEPFLRDYPIILNYMEEM